MTKAQKLQKVVEYAIKNGYKPDGLLGDCLSGRMGVGMDSNIYNHIASDRQYYIHIFSHDFAMAVFGNKIKKEFEIQIRDESFRISSCSWKHHLKEAVLSEDPIGYYYDYINENKT